MTDRAVDVFFYGSYINFNVLKEVDISKRAFEVGLVNGFVLTISPLANLKYKKQGIAYGILTRLTHEVEIEILGHRRSAHMISEPLFDPGADRMRG